MNKEELLKTRYKVIANWPSMKDFSLNQIIVLDKEFSPQYMMWTITDCQGERRYITKFFDDYPHLFKKLEWWMHRDNSEMPKYVRWTATNKFGEIQKSEFIREENTIILDGCKMTFSSWIIAVEPATEEEYNEYIASKP